MAIYARLENGTYAEVTGVYKTDGTEITEIFQGDRLVYSATNEIYGTVPLYYNGKGYDLTDYLLSGNTVQDGTPSPDAPVDAAGCGVRTGNLIDYAQSESGGIDANGKFVPASNLWRSTVFTPIVSLRHFISWTNVTGIVAARINYYTAEKSHISREQIATTGTELTIPQNAAYFKWTLYAQTGTEIDLSYVEDLHLMLNTGSTALPYEPYGYKLPLTVNGVEYPIYLGQVETTRQIWKFKLETPAAVKTVDGGYQLRFVIPKVAMSYRDARSICNIAAWDGNNARTGHVVSTTAAYITQHISEWETIESATAWFAEHDVYVWYVLAEPETAVVNEPLMKIGDYADTISFAQAGVTIPTVNGANVLDMTSPVKPSEVYIKGKGIKPTGYGQLTDVNGVNILDKDGRPIYVHGQ